MTWTEFKTLAGNIKAKIQLIKETSKDYHLRFYNSRRAVTFILPKTSPASSDQTDFENNFLADTDQQILDTIEDFSIGVSEGLIVQHASVNKFGANDSLNSSLETIWIGDSRYTFPSSAATLTVSNSSANDAAAGTGAQQIKIQGVNSSYTEIEETVTMNGTTSVTTSSSFLRVNRAFVTSAGSGGENAGDISIKNSGTEIGKISTGLNQTLQAIYTVPGNKTGFIKSYYYSIPKDKEAECRLYVKEADGVSQAKHQLFLQEAYVQHVFSFPLKVSEKSDIELTAKSLDGTTYSVSAGFDIMIVDN